MTANRESPLFPGSGALNSRMRRRLVRTLERLIPGSSFSVDDIEPRSGWHRHPNNGWWQATGLLADRLVIVRSPPGWSLRQSVQWGIRVKAGPVIDGQQRYQAAMRPVGAERL